MRGFFSLFFVFPLFVFFSCLALICFLHMYVIREMVSGFGGEWGEGFLCREEIYVSYYLTEQHL